MFKMWKLKGMIKSVRYRMYQIEESLKGAIQIGHGFLIILSLISELSNWSFTGDMGENSMEKWVDFSELSEEW